MTDQYVCVIGSLNYDIIMKQKRLPIPGETYTADSISCSGGGKGANQAVQCAKLGLKTMLVGSVGSDIFGELLYAGLKRYGLDLSRIHESSRPTGMGIIHALEDGTVYASIITGANYDIMEQQIDEWDSIIKNSRMVILQMEIPIPVIEQIIRRAKGYGIYTILNAAPAKPINREVMAMTDCLIVNESEAAWYIGKEINDFTDVCEHQEQLKQLNAGTVIVTLGAKGSAVLCSGQPVFIGAIKGINAIESTGAGDSYIGAFAYGIIHGMKEQEACRFAARVAAVTVTKIGTWDAMPYLNEL